MKKNKYNNQLPPYLFANWIKGGVKSGVVIKKKIITQTTITEIKEVKDTNSDLEDDNIINQLKRFIINLMFFI